MNFTEFKTLSRSQKYELLTDKFRKECADQHLDGMVREKGIEISETERIALYGFALHLCFNEELDYFTAAVPWSADGQQPTWGTEMIRHFRKFLPYIFGYGRISRPTIGLVALFHEHFGNIDALDKFLIESEFPRSTVRALVDHLNKQNRGQFDEKQIDNAIRRHFS